MNVGMSRRGFLMAAASTAAAGAAKGAVVDRSVPQDPQFGAKTGPLGKYVGRLAPGRYDAHTHVYPGDPDPDRLVKSFADAGLVGGVVFSRCPNGWQVPGARLLPPEEAMDNVIAWCSGSPSIYPFYWIDPAVDNAVELVDMAVAYPRQEPTPALCRPGSPRPCRAPGALPTFTGNLYLMHVPGKCFCGSFGKVEEQLLGQRRTADHPAFRLQRL